MVFPGRYSTNPNDENDDGGAARPFSALSASSTPPLYDQAAQAPSQDAHAYASSAAMSNSGTSVTELRRYWDQHSRQQDERRSSRYSLQSHQYEHQYRRQVQEVQQQSATALTVAPDQAWLFRYPQAVSSPETRHSREYADAAHQSSSFSSYDRVPSAHSVLDVRRRSFTGKRKASDDIDVDADEFVDNDELTAPVTNVHDYSNPPYRTMSPLPSSSSSQFVDTTSVQITASNLRRARSMDKNMKIPAAAATSMYATTDDDIQTRRLPLRNNFVHGSDTAHHHPPWGWLRREELEEREPGIDERENQAEEETMTRSKNQIPPHSQLAGQLRSAASSPTLLASDTGTRYKQAAAPSQRDDEAKDYTPPRLHLSPLRLASPTAPASEDAQAVLPGRMIANASKNVTFAMLQPHFNRPLQEAALHFGVCTTLLKKICRKNGIKNWPFRRICGLHKSIASMEKQVHYFDGEQKRSYADQLHKLQLELEAYTRTGNAPTPEFMASGELTGRKTPVDQEEPEEMLEDDAETKTEEVDLAENARPAAADRFSSSTAVAPVFISSSSSTLSAVSTRVSVSSYGYALSNSHSPHEQYPSHLLHTNRVMASTVELGDDGDAAFPAYDPRRHAAWPSTQQTRQLRMPRPLPTASASIRSVYPTLRPLQHALPSLSSILHRQQQSQSPPANPR